MTIFVQEICHFCLRPLNYLLQVVFLTLVFAVLLNLRSARSSGLLDIPSNGIKCVVGFNTSCSYIFEHRLPWGFHKVYCSNCRLVGSNTLHVCRQTLLSWGSMLPPLSRVEMIEFIQTLRSSITQLSVWTHFFHPWRWRQYVLLKCLSLQTYVILEPRRLTFELKFNLAEFIYSVENRE
jgi:hypothetical protein